MHEIEVPTLVLCGQYCELTAACAPRMHNALPDPEITVLPNAWHTAMCGVPEAYLGRVRKFQDKQRRKQKAK